MGTTITVTAAAGSHRCRAFFAAAEARLSRFLDDSELSQVNRDGAASVEVSPTLAEVLSVAAAMRDRTDGLVDPGVGGAVVSWGYDRPFAELTGVADPPPPQTLGDWEIRGRTLLRRPGTLLDLGGIAKGWAADVAVERGMASVVSAGGDIRSAVADTVVDVLDGEGISAALVHLGVGGLATSSVTRRRWETTAGTMSHVVDPRTMEPTRSPTLSATARCDTAAESEAAAKATLLLGEEGLRWAAAQGWIDAAMVVWHDGSVFATRGWEMAA